MSDPAGDGSRSGFHEAKNILFAVTRLTKPDPHRLQFLFISDVKRGIALTLGGCFLDLRSVVSTLHSRATANLVNRITVKTMCIAVSVFLSS